MEEYKTNNIENMHTSHETSGPFKLLYVPALGHAQIN